MVIIPIGAIPRRRSSDQLIDVERNCLVDSSPKSVNKGAKSVNKLLAKFWAFTVGPAVGAVSVLDLFNVLILR